RFVSSLGIDEELRHGIPHRRCRLTLGEWKHERLRRGLHLEHFLAIVMCDGSDFHSSPSDSSCAISSRIRRFALPCIGFWLSRSHFTTSLPSRYTWTCRGGWSPIHVTKT